MTATSCGGGTAGDGGPSGGPGAWTLGDGETHELRDPADVRCLVGTVRWSTPHDVAQAFGAARRAAPGWAATPALARSEILHRAAATLLAGRDEIARRLVAEEGKQLADAAGEVDRSAAVLRYFASALLAPDGVTFPPEKPGSLALLRRHPVGVVSLVTPFNFPLLVPVWKLAPALAYGNTVVWKCSELVPVSAIALVRALHAAGLPDDALRLVTGGPDVGVAMSADLNVDAITFTGSTAVGRLVQHAVAGRFVKVQLEMGGSNPAVVLAGADLDAAVDHVAKGAFGAAGQRCTAIRRAVVDRTLHDEFCSRIVARVRGWKLGSGLDPATQMPPMVSARQRRTAIDGVQRCVSEGAELLLGGTPPEDPELANGHYLGPVVLAGVTPGCFTWREEIFGPVLSVIAADGEDHAVAIANDTPYGLNAGVFTTSAAAGLRVAQQLRAGMVHLNAVGGFPPHVPFGGVGDSGYGPLEQGTTAVDFFTNAQVLNLHGSA